MSKGKIEKEKLSRLREGLGTENIRKKTTLELWVLTG